MGPAPRCIVCGGTSLAPLACERRLTGSTTRANSLYPFTLLHCESCGLIQKDLDPTWHECLEGLYTRHYDDYRVVGRQVNYVGGKIVDRDDDSTVKLDRLLDLGESGAMLDVGCGAGRFIAAFARRKPGWSVAGYDVGDAHRAEVDTTAGVKFYSGPNGLRGISQRFDLITLNHVLEHLPNPIEVLREIADLLKPAGRLVVRVPSFAAVNTDFFLMEHCSHFAQETLQNTLVLAGFEVVVDLSGFATIEIGVVARRACGAQETIAYDPFLIKERALDCLAWAESLPGFVRANTSNGPAGLFGVGGAGIWLGVSLRQVISFFVDEDPGKQGHEFAGCPILAPIAVAPGALVFVTFNSAEASAKVYDRLSIEFRHARFLAPPPVRRHR
jgi:SAM-dependent methyltransferase